MGHRPVVGNCYRDQWREDGTGRGGRAAAGNVDHGAGICSLILQRGRKFLKEESTELSHIASLVTHYALAHPEKHFELHSATNAMLVAPAVEGYSERVYQVFGKETLDQLIAVAAVRRLEHVGLPQPPPWRRQEVEDEEESERGAGATPGEMRLHGFVSKPEIQKLNRNSIYVFVNGRLIRDRLVQHGLTEAYRNIIPPTVYPVVLLFLELPAGEVDVNVHPSKTEVRFRQSTVLHDFVRDTVRAALMKASSGAAASRGADGSTRASDVDGGCESASTGVDGAVLSQVPDGRKNVSIDRSGG